jgi:hypothetical protein
MNRLEATVVTGRGGEVDCRGVRLVVDAARGRPEGTRVVVRFPPDSPRILALPPR